MALVQTEVGATSLGRWCYRAIPAGRWDTSRGVRLATRAISALNGGLPKRSYFVAGAGGGVAAGVAGPPFAWMARTLSACAMLLI
jgi:hypothetical protein